ncbi:6-phospho-beta-glucosidase [Lentzea sp. BCCO 10_0061]|uniref:6-phospho-beta-glucosidase n=1 Tax=Lentzea sokolovensis TaxID=3095429 RepID=A0ABU4V2Z9_9PSEU|nr:6-phospho-beta-glucosidase [Lentzea sp. BCCO 10_0061]MDX8146172.1 6-phospho-beta-glucosidase [Lentzea sp. BCCO 10_0061]
MKLVILGGGGFRVPLVYRALLADRSPRRVTQVVLHDLDSVRLAAISGVLASLATDISDAPAVTTSTDLDEALRGADFVFSAIRVGGLDGRAADESVAAGCGVLGQETVGAGGVAYGLRTVPVALDIARRISVQAPDAWVINFTNPAGMVTEAMSTHLGNRVIGICDSPVGLGKRVARAVGASLEDAWLDYAGLNHLGWLRGVHVRGRDVLPDLLADAERLESFEEGKLFGAEWLRMLGAIPNEYLHYYYFTREAVESGTSRGAFLLEQQKQFYAAPSWESWERTRLEREQTYMAETRDDERDSDDLDGGGYERVALDLMHAITSDQRATLILNVPNGTTLSCLDADAIVEVPSLVDANGARPVSVSQVPDEGVGLVTALKVVERATIKAAISGERAHAVKAVALHPLVDSVSIARKIVDAHPLLSGVFRATF